MTLLTVSNQGFTVHNHTCGINFLSHLRGAPQSPRQSGMHWDEPGGVGLRSDYPSIGTQVIGKTHRRGRLCSMIIEKHRQECLCHKKWDTWD
jgi:hypothetical protein